MSPEQSLTPNNEQLDAQSGTLFDNEDVLNFREAGTVLSYQELKKREARAEIAAAMSAVPEASLEIEPIRLSPQALISLYSRATIALRSGRKYDFDMSGDDELDPTMFDTMNKPAVGANDSRGDFDLAA